MVTTRRERARKGNTFLECVKSSLAGLQADMIAIKSSIDELKRNCFNANYDNPGMDDWTTWLALGWEQQEACACPTTTSQLSSTAPCFYPLGHTTTLSRDFLLQHRFMVDDSNGQTEGRMVKAASLAPQPQPVGSIARLWARRRPSAKVRRRRRQQVSDKLESHPPVCTLSTISSCSDTLATPGSYISYSSECKKLCSDEHEMVLPVSTATWLASSSQQYPLDLQRSVFFASVPHNPVLLEAIELGFERGSFYRQDWKEDALVFDETLIGRWKKSCYGRERQSN